MEERGWSQRDLAFILGVSEQAINPILNGKRGISPEIGRCRFGGSDRLHFGRRENSYDAASIFWAPSDKLDNWLQRKRRFGVFSHHGEAPRNCGWTN
ncbi:MAG: hypothetical protein DMG38_11500 [Acidobacteria bacterium]|nr:MAG: hypothetical protein DMG38_11500 [Acidobacteriota bacterium]